MGKWRNAGSLLVQLWSRRVSTHLTSSQCLGVKRHSSFELLAYGKIAVYLRLSSLPEQSTLCCSHSPPQVCSENNVEIPVVDN